MRSVLSGSGCSAADVAGVALPAEAWRLSPPEHAAGSGVSKFAARDGLSPQIEFEASLRGEHISLDKQREFSSDLDREIARLERWSRDENWPALPCEELRVVVSERFKISKSLVPAWSGRKGHMEFPAWRVVARKAAIAHELTHVFFPNGNRLLAEGLAIYLQAEIGSNPAFPNFGKPLHGLVRELVSKMLPGFRAGDTASLEAIHLADLDAIATPSPLTLTVGTDMYGEEPRGQTHIYPLAGSFVQHLIETRGLDAFRRLYALTPLVPLHHDAGAPGRWTEAYGMPLQSIESEWRSMIASR